MPGLGAVVTTVMLAVQTAKVSGFIGNNNWSPDRPFDGQPESDWETITPPSDVLCHSGKFQSPINVEPRLLLYDPRLQHLITHTPDRVSGTMTNTGEDLVFTLDDFPSNHVNVSAGPFMYRYKLSKVKFKVGRSDTHGSEHRIDGKAFSAEIQLICYNSDLTDSLVEATRLPYGVAILSVFAEAQDKGGNTAFKTLVDAATEVPWQKQKTRIPNLDLRTLMPDTTYYVTYEGSFTQDGCQETVTWVLLNKPIKVESSQLDTLRQLQKQEQDRSSISTLASIRPVKPLHNRSIRTNINYPISGTLCTMKKDTFYQVNEKM